MLQNPSIDLSKVSDDLLANWKPILCYLRAGQLKEISDAAFCGVVAFMGIHLCLWPQWIKLWDDFISLDQHSFDLNEEIAGNRPWFCLNFSYGKNTLLSHVQTEDVSVNREYIKTFLKPAFLHMFRSLNEQGLMIQYDQAVKELVQMGYTDYEVLAFSVDSDKGLPETSQFNKKQLPSTKKIPVISMNLIEEQQETWLNLAKLTGEILSCISKSYSKEEWKNQDVKGIYSCLATLLWNKLINAEVINPVGDKPAGFSRFIKSKQDSYRGNLLIYGDHESFWQRYNRDFLVDSWR
ncbi:MAG: hypothetical protein LLG05_17325 [Porphyromonadaceae bacterium]|nr:hypothetical protein [Porphyromonadaceae bacterium]